MKEHWISVLLAALMLLAMPLASFAEDYEGSDDWIVVFTQEKKMESNFKSSDIDDVIAGMQPGDTTVFRISLQNDYKDTSEWYMSNEVLKTLEDTSSKGAAGGVYSYELVYTDKGGKDVVLFSSDKVGGDDPENQSAAGLHDVTKVLEDYLFLDTLPKGDSGTVTLTVGLEGETQGNNYQDTMADIQLQFAIELDKDTVVVTGDNNNLLPLYYTIMTVSGGILVLIAVLALKRRRREGEEQA